MERVDPKVVRAATDMIGTGTAVVFCFLLFFADRRKVALPSWHSNTTRDGTAYLEDACGTLGVVSRPIFLSTPSTICTLLVMFLFELVELACRTAIGHASKVARPLPWADRERIVRRDAEIRTIREEVQRARKQHPAA